MRERGLGALDYKAIILDEVHERSVESDLVLVCVKQFLLKNKNMRFSIFLLCEFFSYFFRFIQVFK